MSQNYGNGMQMKRPEMEIMKPLSKHLMEIVAAEI